MKCDLNRLKEDQNKILSKTEEQTDMLRTIIENAEKCVSPNTGLPLLINIMSILYKYFN